MRLPKFQFETKLQKCIRMGKAIYKIFILGSILSDIRSEITFYGSAGASRKTKFPTVYPTIYTSPNENFDYSYPLSGSISLGLNYCKSQTRSQLNII